MAITNAAATPIIRQPLAGIASTLVIIAISFGFISLFDAPTLTGAIAYYLMWTIPVTLVVGVVWAGNYPAFVAGRRQPVRGFILLVIALAVGFAIAATHLIVVGEGAHPPVQSTIVSVVVALWMTIVWEGWPFTLVRRPLLAGVGLLVGYYVVAQVLFHTFAGMFDAASVVGFCVTAAAAKFLTLHFDLWPLSRRTALMRHPVLGLVWTAIALALGGSLYLVCSRALGMPPPVVLTTVSIPFVFGSIVVLNMFGGSLFGGLPQPVKGVASASTAAAIGTVLSLVYGSLASVLTGPVQPGPPEFAFEIWLASALLAVTFPFLDYHAHLFDMWPFAHRQGERCIN
jgi:hypothetical protein